MRTRSHRPLRFDPRLEVLEGRATPALLGGLLSPVESLTSAVTSLLPPLQVDLGVDLGIVQTDVSLNTGSTAPTTGGTTAAPPLLDVSLGTPLVPTTVDAQVGGDSLATVTTQTPVASTGTTVSTTPASGDIDSVLTPIIGSGSVTAPAIPGTPGAPTAPVTVPGNTSAAASVTPTTVSVPATIDASQPSAVASVSPPVASVNPMISVPNTVQAPASETDTAESEAAVVPNTTTAAVQTPMAVIAAPGEADLGLVGEEPVETPADESELPDAVASGLATEPAPFSAALVEQALRQYLDGLDHVREAVEGWAVALGPWSLVCVGVTVAAAGELARRRLRRTRVRLAGAGGEDVDSWFYTNLTPGA
jgi:hypothetical protein